MYNLNAKWMLNDDFPILFIFQRWENSRESGFSKETFLALRHTCIALSRCCRYILSHLGFEYVLLGKLQSDNIESRFGHYRQLSGANYFISVRDVVQSERKIRALSLLKFSKVTVQDIDAAIENQTNDTDHEIQVLASQISEALHMDYNPTESEENIILYVSGAICRSTLRSTKCSACKEILCTDCTELSAEVMYIDENSESLLNFQNIVNRGGLLKPSDFAFNLCMLSFRIFEEMKCNERMMSALLKCSKQRQLFHLIVESVIDESFFTDTVFGNDICTNDHKVLTLIIYRFFNTMMKGLSRNLTIEASNSRQKSKCKISKLNSSSVSS